jgi:DHA2 family multidrug resistance protein
VWGTGALVVPLKALPVAGYVIDLFGWPGVFYMSLPIGALALLGTLAVVPEVKNRAPRRRLDGFGLVLLLIGFGALQYALSRGVSQDWFASTEIVVASMVLVVCAYVFAVHCATTRDPLLPAALFRHRNLSLGLAGVFVFGLTLTLVNLLLALMRRNQLGYPAHSSRYGGHAGRKLGPERDKSDDRHGPRENGRHARVSTRHSRSAARRSTWRTTP